MLIDIADPTSPAVLAVQELDGFVSQISVRGSRAYLADFFYGGLFVVDIADPTRPDLETTVPSRPFAQHLAQVGDHLLVGTGGFAAPTVQVFDLADPDLPVLVDEFFPAGEAVNGLTTHGDRVFVSVGHAVDGELLILDGTDPAAMQPLGSLGLDDEPHEVEVDGATAYVTTYAGTVHVIDVTDPTAPVPIGRTYLPDSAFVLALSDRALHAATTDAGLALLPLHCATVLGVEDDPRRVRPPAAPTALRAHPNPFNPAVSLTFNLERAGRISLTVYDVAGRRLARLYRGELSAGRHVLSWDGRGDDGRALPSGVYLARLAGEGGVAATRLVLAR